MIILTSEHGDLVYVNEKLITHFFECGMGTHLEVVGPEMLFVKESPEEIMRIVKNKETINLIPGLELK